MMPSLGLNFSPLPAGDLVSRESQKTRKFGMEGGVLLGFRVSNKTDGRDQFSVFPGVRWKIRLCRLKEHGEVSIPSKIQPNRTAGSKDIGPPS